MGASEVPPETKPEGIAGNGKGMKGEDEEGLVPCRCLDTERDYFGTWKI